MRLVKKCVNLAKVKEFVNLAKVKEFVNLAKVKEFVNLAKVKKCVNLAKVNKFVNQVKFTCISIFTIRVTLYCRTIRRHSHSLAVVYWCASRRTSSM